MSYNKAIKDAILLVKIHAEKSRGKVKTKLRNIAKHLKILKK